VSVDSRVIEERSAAAAPVLLDAPHPRYFSFVLT
jgi:hypothetical protein